MSTISIKRRLVTQERTIACHQTCKDRRQKPHCCWHSKRSVIWSPRRKPPSRSRPSTCHRSPPWRKPSGGLSSRASAARRTWSGSSASSWDRSRAAKARGSNRWGLARGWNPPPANAWATEIPPWGGRLVPLSPRPTWAQRTLSPRSRSRGKRPANFRPCLRVLPKLLAR